MNRREELTRLVEEKLPIFTALSDQVWDYAELPFEEVQSSAAHVKCLEEQGFEVTHGVDGMPTAIIAQYGSGKPVVAILGEYDALPTLNQKANCFTREPTVPGAPGHGCGHHLLGGGGVSAATAVKDYMQAHNLPGTVRYYGCPAEEGGSAKAYLARDGFFADVDIALAWHPTQFNYAWDGHGCLGTYGMEFHFKGISAHAATSPHEGRSALDACELTNVGVNYLREHIIDSARIHYSYLNAGGPAANVVQGQATLFYMIRAPFMEEVFAIADRVKEIARGAAIMTQTELEVKIVGGTSNIMGNRTICERYEENLRSVLPVEYAPEELQYASEFRSTLEKFDVNRLINGLRNFFPDKELSELKEMAQEPIMNFYYLDNGPHASTDVGDVSWNVPTAQLHTACVPTGMPFHTWQMTAVGKSSIAHKGMATAAKTLAMTALDFLTDPQLVEKAARQFAADMEGRTYRAPLPEGAKPGKKN